ncbi:MAG: lysylphosphatidylglycerol synthase domain-containing protein [Christensenellales bacterium]
MTALKTAILGKYYDFITPLGSGGQPFQIVYLSTQKKIPIGPATSIPLSGMIVYQVGYVCFAISMFVVYACIPHSLPLATPVLYLAGFGAFCYLIVPAIVVLFSVFRETTLKILRFFVKLGHKMSLSKTWTQR